MSAARFIPPILVMFLGAFGVYQVATTMGKQRSFPTARRPRNGSVIKVSPQKVLDMLASEFHVSAPRLVLTEDMPQAWRAYYEQGEKTIYLRPSEKEPLVVAHEYGHHLHTALGISCGGKDCEKYADFVERHYVKVLEPRLAESLMTQGSSYARFY